MQTILKNILKTTLICMTLSLISISLITKEKRKALSVEITSGRLVTPRLAVVNFKSNDHPQAKKIAEIITKIIKKNLGNSNVFSVVPKVAFINDLKQYNKVTEFTDWQAIDVRVLVDGMVEFDPITSNIKVKFAVYDVILQEIIISKMFTASVNLHRRIGHKISDSIYNTFTGDTSIFDKKIVCVQHYLNDKKEKKQRLITIDQDAHHLSMKILNNSDSLITNPVFLKNNKKIIYLQWLAIKNSKKNNFFLKNKKIRKTGDFDSPILKILDTQTNRIKEIQNIFHKNEMFFAPSFSKDGKYMLLSISKNGTSHIYEYDMNKKNFRQITSGPYLDTSAVFSHDENMIFFVSNRSGRPNIFSIQRNGRKLQRVTFGPGAYYNPTCSPNGKHLSFIKAMHKSFYIGCMEMDEIFTTDNERLIARALVIDSLRWISNEVMSFSYTPFSNSKESIIITKIGTIDLSGHKWRTIDIPDSVSLSSPMWSNS